MEKKFTEGPYYIYGTGNHQRVIASEANGENIAVVYDAKNAPLLASAPELLEAFEESTKTYGKLHDMLSDCIESGRLTEADLPDDYEAIVKQLIVCVKIDQDNQIAINKALGKADHE